MDVPHSHKLLMKRTRDQLRSHKPLHLDLSLLISMVLPCCAFPFSPNAKPRVSALGISPASAIPSYRSKACVPVTSRSRVNGNRAFARIRPRFHGVGFSPPDTIHDVPVDFYCTDWWKSFNTNVAGYPILSTLHQQATKGNYGVEVR